MSVGLGESQGSSSPSNKSSIVDGLVAGNMFIPQGADLHQELEKYLKQHEDGSIIVERALSGDKTKLIFSKIDEEEEKETDHLDPV